MNTFYGRLLFSGSIPLFRQPVIINAVGEESISFVDVSNGEVLREIHGGFERVFRAVVSHNTSPTLVFTTWNAQNRRSTIQTYDLEDHGGAYQGYKMGLNDSFDFNSRSSGAVIHRQKEEDMRPTAPEVISQTADRSRLRLLFEGDSRDGVTSLVITLASPPLICSGHYDFVVRLWSLETKQLVMSLEGHTDYVGSVAAWKGHEPIVVSGSTDGSVKAWNAQSGALIATGEGHTRDAWAVAVTTGPKPLIISGSFDRTVSQLSAASLSHLQLLLLLLGQGVGYQSYLGGTELCAAEELPALPVQSWVPASQQTSRGDRKQREQQQQHY